MASVSERTARQQRIMAPLLVTAILLAGLPVAVWLDLRGLSEQMLQAAAAPGGITMSYETAALVSDGVRASPQEPIRMKGISRDVVPYAVADDLTARDRGETQDTVFSGHARGIDLYVDVEALEADGAARLRKRLLDTLAAVERHMTGAERPARDSEPHPEPLHRAAG